MVPLEATASDCGSKSKYGEIRRLRNTVASALEPIPGSVLPTRNRRFEDTLIGTEVADASTPWESVAVTRILKYELAGALAQVKQPVARSSADVPPSSTTQPEFEALASAEAPGTGCQSSGDAVV